jgi:hypothetical protein
MLMPEELDWKPDALSQSLMVFDANADERFVLVDEGDGSLARVDAADMVAEMVRRWNLHRDLLVLAMAARSYVAQGTVARCETTSAERELAADLLAKLDALLAGAK